MLEEVACGIPNLEGEERNTLYIIGNGFDLYHGVRSKYRHFFCWLNLKGYENIANAIQTMFPKLNLQIDSLWQNFEAALGVYDVDDLYSRNYVRPDNPWDDIEEGRAIKEATDKVANVCARIKPLLKTWAKDIEIDYVKPLCNLSKGSKFLTFNYTMVLEEIYGIPSSNICHIHESVRSNEDLIVGHDAERLMKHEPISDDEIIKQEYIAIMNGLEKDKQRQYEKYRDFFSSLKTINHVVVLGHSLADPDLFYFGKVIDECPNAQWYFSVYSDEDKKQVTRFANLAKSAMQEFKEPIMFNL